MILSKLSVSTSHILIQLLMQIQLLKASRLSATTQYLTFLHIPSPFWSSIYLIIPGLSAALPGPPIKARWPAHVSSGVSHSLTLFVRRSAALQPKRKLGLCWQIDLHNKHLIHKNSPRPPTNQEILPVLEFWSFLRVLIVLVASILFCNVCVSPFTAVMSFFVTSQLCQLLHVQAQGLFDSSEMWHQ